MLQANLQRGGKRKRTSVRDTPGRRKAMLVELSTNPAGYLRAAFRFTEPRHMRVELDISMVGGTDGDATKTLASLRRLIDDSSHALTSHDVCGECNWYGLMALVRRCH